MKHIYKKSNNFLETILQLSLKYLGTVPQLPAKSFLFLSFSQQNTRKKARNLQDFELALFLLGPSHISNPGNFKNKEFDINSTLIIHQMMMTINRRPHCNIYIYLVVIFTSDYFR